MSGVKYCFEETPSYYAAVMRAGFLWTFSGIFRRCGWAGEREWKVPRARGVVVRLKVHKRYPLPAD